MFPCGMFLVSEAGCKSHGRNPSSACGHLSDNVKSLIFLFEVVFPVAECSDLFLNACPRV